MVKEIHVAIIGAGYWGSKLIREYLMLSMETDIIRLRTIVDLDRERLREALKMSKDICENCNLNATTDVNDILEDDEITAVHIATPNKTHFRLASLMLKNNKHVLLEKPMAMSARDAFKLARIAEEENKVLMVGHIFRFNEAIRKIGKILLSNREEIYYMDLIWSTYITPPSGRDIIFDLAPHPIDIVNYITGEWPKKVYTIGNSYIRKQRGLEEVAFANMELPSDILVDIKLSWIERGPKRRTISIISNKNTYFIDALNQKIICFDGVKEKQIPLEPTNTMKEMIKHFAETIRYNKAPKNSALIGALTVSVLEAMKKSLEKKKPMNVTLT